MSSTSRFKRPKRPRRARVLTDEKLDEWLATGEHPMPGVSMIESYLAALVVSPQFIPPEDWLRPIVGDGIAWAPDGNIEEALRNTIFQRYSQIGATLSGGPKRYAPIYMRTDAGEVLLEDFANGFYIGMRLSIDDWKPHISNPEIGHPPTAILGRCTTMMPDDQRQNALRGQAGEILVQSWKVVPELVEMLHVSIGGARNIEIR